MAKAKPLRDQLADAKAGIERAAEINARQSGEIGDLNDRMAKLQKELDEEKMRAKEAAAEAAETVRVLRADLERAKKDNRNRGEAIGHLTEALDSLNELS